MKKSRFTDSQIMDALKQTLLKYELDARSTHALLFYLSFQIVDTSPIHCALESHLQSSLLGRLLDDLEF